MAPRPHWKGYLKLSLVSCPIALYPAVSPAERISFRQVNKRTGNRVRQQLVDVVTGESVAREDKGRGYEIGQNQFLPVEEHEIEQARLARAPVPGAATSIVPSQTPASRQTASVSRPFVVEQDDKDADDAGPPVTFAKPENTRTIEIDRFFPVAQIDPRYFEKPYYIVPREEVGQEAFAVIRDAMGNQKMAGLGRVILSSRERPILVEAMENGLRGMTLRFNYEVRDAAQYFGEIPEMKLPKEMLRLAEHIIETKAGDFDPALLEDHYRNAMVHILRQKQTHLRAKSHGIVKPSRENVVSIMDALKRSLAAEKNAPRPIACKAAVTSKRAAKKLTSRRRRVG
jgi:non-homologous end joining protein Ku